MAASSALSFRILPFANSSWGTGVQDSNLIYTQIYRIKDAQHQGLLVLKISFSFCITLIGAELLLWVLALGLWLLLYSIISKLRTDS